MARTVLINHDGWRIMKDFKFFLSLKTTQDVTSGGYVFVGTQFHLSRDKNLINVHNVICYLSQNQIPGVSETGTDLLSII